MSKIPEVGYLRLSQILGSAKSGIAPIIPVCKTTWWEGVKSGRFPKPTRRLGPRIAAWRVEDIRALVERESNGGER
jgi:prophage regulatory protein